MDGADTDQPVLFDSTFNFSSESNQAPSYSCGDGLETEALSENFTAYFTMRDSPALSADHGVNRSSGYHGNLCDRKGW